MPNSAVKPLILVVEDDPAVRNLIVAALEAHGLRHMAVETAHAAIAAASSQTPSIVLLDLGLPDMDGVKVVESVRAWSGMPIIVVSARSEDADKIRALDAGADDYLTKPFSLLVAVPQISCRINWCVSTLSALCASRHRSLYSIGVRCSSSPSIVAMPASKSICSSPVSNEPSETTKSDLASLRVFMGTLRKKIESDPAHPRYIQTHVGIGYRLVIQG